jgi:hypothetical protein
MGFHQAPEYNDSQVRGAESMMEQRSVVTRVANITCEFAGNALKLKDGQFPSHSS